MKHLLTNYITTTAAQPVKQGTLDHLQESYIECIEALARQQIGEGYDATKVYILFGCVNSTTAPIYTVSAGAIFYAGEIYLVPAFSFTAADTAIGTVTTAFVTAANADPVEFTDGIDHDVHQVKTMVVTDGASVGNLDFANWGTGWVSVSDPAQATLGVGTGSITACVVETRTGAGFVIKRFKITANMSSGTLRVDFPLTGMVSDTFYQAILCPFYISTTFNNMGTGTVVGNTLQITSATGSVGAAIYIIAGQILYKA